MSITQKIIVFIILLTLTMPAWIIQLLETISEYKNYPKYIARDSLKILIILTPYLFGVDILVFLYFFC